MRRFFLGGHDLEMTEIARLLTEAGEAFEDLGLAWGACASAYLTSIERSVAEGETPVLVELAPDLPAELHAHCVEVDHHGDRAGSDQPSSLEQVWRLIGADPARWTRWRVLVAANDIGHIPALRRTGASDEEIRAVRAADRASQGVTAQDEARAAAASRAHRRLGTLVVVETDLNRSSPIIDHLALEMGVPVETTDILVLMPGEAAFFGAGRIIGRLSDWPGAWWGGDLPERGYWGAKLREQDRARLIKACA